MLQGSAQKPPLARHPIRVNKHVTPVPHGNTQETTPVIRSRGTKKPMGAWGGLQVSRSQLKTHIRINMDRQLRITQPVQKTPTWRKRKKRQAPQADCSEKRAAQLRYSLTVLERCQHTEKYE